MPNVESFFPREMKEAEEEYLSRLISFAQQKIGGYSISHVSGRFRATDLLDRKSAGALLASGEPYLIDETTAIVRFIIPCSTDVQDYDDSLTSILDAIDTTVDISSPQLGTEIRKIRHLFYHLFVEAVARTVVEQEIWLVERSPLGERLYVWSRT